MARVYATHADLVTYTQGSSFAVPSEPESARVRTRASELVDEKLITAIYDTDPNTLLPTDADVAAAMRDAVCAQVVWWDETGDELGAGGQYTSVSIGSVALSRGSNANSSVASPGRQLAPQAATHLQLAGLLPGVVIHGW